MRIYILSSEFSNSFNNEISKLSHDIVYLKTPSSLGSISELKNDEEKILVIDPDFVNWEITEADLSIVPNIKSILITSTSFSWISPEYLKSQNIPLINITDYSTHAVAEYATFMAFALARRFPLIMKDNFAIDYEKYKGAELYGKTAGVIGMGNIGTALAHKLKGLGMKVIYWSKNSRNEIGEYSELADLFMNADFIFPTMAENPETKQIITDDLLSKLQVSSYFISIVHHYYNHQKIIEMVTNNLLAGYAFEDDETQIKDYKGNIFVSPHYAWLTNESLQNNEARLLANIKSVLNGDFSKQVQL